MRPVPAATLAVFRALFGLLMLFSAVRFLALGWVERQYLEGPVHFKYYGFEWVEPLPGAGMYILYAVLIAASVFVTLGLFYRVSIIVVWVVFTYCELIDLTYYLNHYYLVSLVAFLLIFLPANRAFSLDALRRPEIARKFVPLWSVGLLRFQLSLVYFYAGLAKLLSADWMLRALPLKIWLPAHEHLPVLGPLLEMEATAFAFSWFGMVYDLTIWAFLLWRPTRAFAYAAVVGFHLMTGLLFQIGVFPYAMILFTLIFFPGSFHQRVINVCREIARKMPTFGRNKTKSKLSGVPRTACWRIKKRCIPAAAFFFGMYVLIQILWPLRSALYPGDLYWREEGYRFSWRVMLVEKAGTALFYVKDGRTGAEGAVANGEFLNRHQEKQMSFQPDMILQYAKFLAGYYAERGVADPKVRAEVYVTLNGRPGRLLFDPQLDLTEIEDGFAPKDWLYTRAGKPAEISAGQKKAQDEKK